MLFIYIYNLFDLFMNIVFGDFCIVIMMFYFLFCYGSSEVACPTSTTKIRVRILIGLFKLVINL